MSFRFTFLTLAVAAATLSPVAAQANGAVQADGWQQVGDSLLYVGQPGAAGKTGVKAEPAATQRGAVGHDGWKSVGDTLVFVGTQPATGKTRAQVQAELAAWVANPVSHDGFAEIGGESLRYVGKPTPADVKLADRHFNAR